MSTADLALSNACARGRQRSERLSLVTVGARGSPEKRQDGATITAPRREFSHVQILAKPPVDEVTRESTLSEVVSQKKSLSGEVSAGMSSITTMLSNDRDSLANMPIGTTFAAKARAAELNAARASRTAAAAKEKELNGDGDAEEEEFRPLVLTRKGVVNSNKRSRAELPPLNPSEDSQPKSSINPTPPPTQPCSASILETRRQVAGTTPSESSVSSPTAISFLTKIPSRYNLQRLSSFPPTQVNNHTRVHLAQPVATSQAFHPNLPYWGAIMPPRFPEGYNLQCEGRNPQDSSHLSPHLGHGHGGRNPSQGRTTYTSTSTPPIYASPSHMNGNGGAENKSPLRLPYTSGNGFNHTPYHQSHQPSTNLTRPSPLSGADDPFYEHSGLRPDGPQSYAQHPQQIAAANSTGRVPAAGRETAPFGPIQSELHPELYHESAHRRYSGVQPLPAPGQSLKEIQDAHFRELAEQHSQKFMKKAARNREWENAGPTSSTKDSKLQVLENSQAEVNAQKSTRTVLHDPLADRTKGCSNGTLPLRNVASSTSALGRVQDSIRSTEPFPLNYPEFDDAFLAGQNAFDMDLNGQTGALTIHHNDHDATKQHQRQNDLVAQPQSETQSDMYLLHTGENVYAQRMYQHLVRENAKYNESQTSIQLTSDPVPNENGRVFSQAPIGSERRQSSATKPKMSTSTSTDRQSTKNFLDMFAPVIANFVDNDLHPSHLAPWGDPPAYAIDHTVAGNLSFFESSWGNPPARVARDPRYRTTMHEGRPTYFEDIGRAKGNGWGRR